ncbi:MAG: hypothetical protein SLAVMIC_00127 [uncultured marine phage]|uniref:Uncharacterized protein n=1 Tax=uncultured marine phage TaxID=707152 RepID=A0A8D9CCI0_9VIRU|nr:MAG: hypothetical protein SLAVMIC_00127 [uncultured marine phage]
MLDNKIMGEPHINSIIGMTEEKAIAHLAKLSKTMRVINRDGEGLMVTMDVDPNRVNVWVRGGVVSHLENMG